MNLEQFVKIAFSMRASYNVTTGIITPAPVHGIREGLNGCWIIPTGIRSIQYVKTNRELRKGRRPCYKGLAPDRHLDLGAWYGSLSKQ